MFTLVLATCVLDCQIASSWPVEKETTPVHGSLSADSSPTEKEETTAGTDLGFSALCRVTLKKRETVSAAACTLFPCEAG